MHNCEYVRLFIYFIYLFTYLLTYFLQIGGVCLERGYYLDEVKLERSGLLLLHSQLPALEALLYCVKMKWMAILVCTICIVKHITP